MGKSKNCVDRQLGSRNFQMWRELGSGNGFGYANLVMEATWDRETGIW